GGPHRRRQRLAGLLGRDGPAAAQRAHPHLAQRLRVQLQQLQRHLPAHRRRPRCDLGNGHRARYRHPHQLGVQRGVPQSGRLRLRSRVGHLGDHLHHHALGQPDELPRHGRAEGGQLMRGSRVHYFTMLAVALVAIAGVPVISATAPETIVRDRMLVIPGGWLRFLGIFVLLCGGIAGVASTYGLATRPLRAGRYAVTAGTHVFMWVVILAVFYPVVYLVAVSFNRNNTLAGALPRTGNLLVRSGVIPDPADFSTSQYVKVLQEFHVTWYQVALVAVLLLAIVGLVAAMLVARNGSVAPARIDAWRNVCGWTILVAVGVIVLTVQPNQFYGLLPDGTRQPASI